MLDADKSLFLMIDIQEKLVAAVSGENVVKNAVILAQAANILNIPMVVSEQYPKGLGHTVLGVSEVISSSALIFDKTAFSVFREPKIKEAVQGKDCKQVVLYGIESHVCVMQSALDLNDAGYEVFVVKDACASRCNEEFVSAMERMKQEGIRIVTVEMVLFELLKTAKNENFKQVQALIK